MRDLSLEECLTRLREDAVGRVAVLENDVPVVVPVNYQLVEVAGIVWIVLRTRPGNLVDTAPMKVGFEIDGIDLVHESGWSVLVRGTLHHVDVTSADFRERFDPHPWLGEDRSAWLVIQPYSITGRALAGTQPTWVFVRSELFLD